MDYDAEKKLAMSFAADIHEVVEISASKYADGLERGKPLIGVNPFTKEEVEFGWPPEVARLHAKLKQHGLENDQSMMSALRSVMTGVTHEAAYTLTCWLDDERQGSDKRRVEIFVNGDRIQDYFGMYYYPGSREF